MFGSKLDQIGPQIGQIRDFFRSDLPNVLKSDLKKSRFVQFEVQSDPLWSQTYHPWPERHLDTDIITTAIPHWAHKESH